MTKYDIAVAKVIIKQKGLKTYFFKTKGKEISRIRKRIAKKRQRKRAALKGWKTRRRK